MDLYGFLLFFHVMGVILWFGAGVVFQVLTERAARSDDPARTRNLVEVGESLGKGYFGLVTLVVLATGLWLVFERDWGFDHVFIIGGLAGLVASAVIGGAVFGPTADRLARRVESATAIDPELRSDLTRLRNLGRVDTGIMLTVVFLMTVKPGS